ncbi:MAG: rhomboid family intramembrane serine protease, partial [Porphyromonadaceae bacterium]|nr:rhomboid family intramembrane serine protease [Porphyromonadaceae bacterium]
MTRNLIVINFIIYFASVLLLRRGFDLAEVAGLHYFESS